MIDAINVEDFVFMRIVQKRFTTSWALSFAVLMYIKKEKKRSSHAD